MKFFPISIMPKSLYPAITEPVLSCFKIVSFKDKATEDIFDGANSKQARKACTQTLWRIASRKLDQMDSVNKLEELKIPPGNRLETLSGDREGFYSIRINEQYRICFAWSDLGPSDVEITDYH